MQMNFLKQRVLSFVVSLALFMEAMDATILNTAIPTMAKNFNVNPIDLKIALISYLLMLAIVIPISGWLADKLGAKKVFIIALTIFIIASFFCGLSSHLLELIIARSIQGIGGALTLPVGRLIIVRTFKHRQFINAMNQIVTVGAFGMMLGPVLGGIITYHFSWHWIFWINVPVGLLAIFLTKYFLKDISPVAVPPLDKIGFLLFATSLSGLMFGLSALSETILNRHISLFIILASFILILIYFWHSKDKKNPVVKISLFYNRIFQIAISGNFLSRLSFGSMPFLLPLLLQIKLHYSAQLSGIVLAPLAGGVLLAKQFSLRLLQKQGFKKYLLINTLLAGIAIWLFMLIKISTSIYIIALLTLFFGLMISLQYSGMNALAYADISTNDSGAATSIMSTVQQFSQSMGVAISALLVNYFSFGSYLKISAFTNTFFFLGFIVLSSSFVFMRLKSTDGIQMIHSDE